MPTNINDRIKKWKILAEQRSAASLNKDESVSLGAIAREASERHFQTILAEQALSLPAMHRRKTFADYKACKAEQMLVKRIAERFLMTLEDRLINGDGFIFAGPPGTGKTLLSILITKNILEAGHAAIYKPNTDFLRELITKKYESYNNYMSYQDAITRTKFLVLDEVTTGSARNGGLNTAEQKMLFNIIDKRYNERKSTLIISNLNASNIAKNIGVSTYDRLIQKNAFIAFAWESYRK